MSAASIPCGLPRGIYEIDVIPWGEPREIYGMRAISRGEGSLSELETQVLIAKRLDYVEQEEALLGRIETVRKLLLGLIRHLKKEST